MRRLAAWTVAALTACVLAAGAYAATSPPMSFTDEAGDSGTAADITKVDVSNDDAGNFIFDVAFATAYGSTHELWIYIDSDNNPATGDPQLDGTDYAFYDDHASHGFDLEQWNGTAWGEAPSFDTGSFSIAQDNLSLTAKINRSEIGNPDAFNFFLFSGEGDQTQGHYDFAPSGDGTYHYATQPTVTLSVAAARQLAAKAGHTWTVAVAVKRSDTGKLVGPEGTIVCSASSGSTKLKVTIRNFVSESGGASSAAVCQFAVPKKLKHKTLNGYVSVSFNGQTVTHTFTAVAK